MECLWLGSTAGLISPGIMPPPQVSHASPRRGWRQRRSAWSREPMETGALGYFPPPCLYLRLYLYSSLRLRGPGGIFFSLFLSRGIYSERIGPSVSSRNLQADAGTRVCVSPESEIGLLFKVRSG